MSSHQHVMPVRTNVTIFVILLVLLFATVGAAYLPLGGLHVPIAMTIATAKAVLIVLFFMHLLYSHRLTMIISVASFVWLAIMIVLTLNDYLTRGVLDIPGK
jgi:cytochrome c oxidase subunit 4